MIGFLAGKPRAMSSQEFVIVCHGVGYEVHVSGPTALEIEGLDHVELWIYTQVREDAIQLFGFATREEKSVFLALLKVNGVGPKSAMNMISATPYKEILKRIDEGDVKALSQLPKVGKKTAEQIVLTLKGKLDFVSNHETSSQGGSKDAMTSALLHLGFRQNEVEKVVGQLPSHLSIEEGVREALRELTN